MCIIILTRFVIHFKSPYCTFFQNHGTGALVVSAMLDMLTFALCLPYSETTESKYFDLLLEMVAKRGRSLFKHFQVYILS